MEGMFQTGLVCPNKPLHLVWGHQEPLLPLSHPAW